MKCCIELYGSFSLSYLADALVRETQCPKEAPFGELKEWAIDDASIEIAEKFEQAAKNIREHCALKMAKR